MKGYWKKLLKINLTHKKIETEKIPKEVITKYLGAKGIGAYYFMKDLPQGIAPLFS
ncbi:hypothetical protein DMNBHIDG_00723 [Candidatus Methanoperedenaceae archaeon GB37]|nr:hypothetical protein DMNBHIDG_00723 [Candidatus Methanoperedenaceae archaeon GB37]